MFRRAARKGQIYTVPFLLMCLFAITRPYFSLEVVANTSIAGLSLMELYGILSSGMLALVAAITPSPPGKKGIVILLLGFAYYSFFTLLWGGAIKDSIRFLLPVIMFFAAKGTLTDEKRIKIFIFILLTAYLIPILGSSFLIGSGKSVSMEVYWTGLVRYKGLYMRIHNLAHSMMIYVVFFLIFTSFNTEAKQNIRQRMTLAIGFGLTICALFNIYKSAVRTVILGLLITICGYLLGAKKYRYLFCLGLILVISLFYSDAVLNMFFDIIDPLLGRRSMESMGSGRVGMWSQILDTFLKQPFENQLFGLGMGEVYRGSFGGEHSDWLSLMTNLGYVGLLFYILIYSKIFNDIVLKSNLACRHKIFFSGFLLAVIFVNFASNSYLSRFDMSQYFFLLLAIFYNMADPRKEESQKLIAIS